MLTTVRGQARAQDICGRCAVLSMKEFRESTVPGMAEDDIYVCKQV
jgi:hypothetical protein